MARHRGVYDPNNPEPYELSRSRIEAFINCPALLVGQLSFLECPVSC